MQALSNNQCDVVTVSVDDEQGPGIYIKNATKKHQGENFKETNFIKAENSHDFKEKLENKLRDLSKPVNLIVVSDEHMKEQFEDQKVWKNLREIKQSDLGKNINKTMAMLHCTEVESHHPADIDQYGEGSIFHYNKLDEYALEDLLKDRNNTERDELIELYEKETGEKCLNHDRKKDITLVEFDWLYEKLGRDWDRYEEMIKPLEKVKGPGAFGKAREARFVHFFEHCDKIFKSA